MGHLSNLCFGNSRQPQRLTPKLALSHGGAVAQLEVVRRRRRSPFPLLTVTFIHFVLNYPSAPESQSSWELLLQSGIIAWFFFGAGLISIPIALFVMFRWRILPWSLLASVMPFIMGSSCGFMVSLGILSYMSAPGMDTVAHHLAIQCRLILGGLLISILLMSISFLTHHMRPQLRSHASSVA
jgi:hypothetical protein